MTALIEYLKRLNITEWIFIFFSLLWCTILGIDYWNKHPLYWISIEHFKYLNLLLFFIFSGIIFSAISQGAWIFKKIATRRINGLVILGLTMLIIVVITASFNHYWKAPLGVYNYLFISGLSLYTLSAGLLLVLSSLCLGHLIRSSFIDLKASQMTCFLVDLCLGFYFFQLVLMLLGSI